jgi:L-threonylcarbamoyladenylate synthase
MQTEQIFENQLEKAAKLLKEDQVVAFPTETVYGLGARLFSEKAIASLYKVKGRPSDNPLIVHVSDLASVERIARDIPDLFYSLFERFFPGPLTLILPKQDSVPAIVSGGLSTVAVRMPSHPIALKLIKLVQEPLVAPSANLSGKPSSTCVEHVLEDFNGKIPGVVVGAPSEIGIESTVVSLLGGKIEILRPGAITKEEIEEHLQQEISVFKAEKASLQAALPSPGMRYRHYAPVAPVLKVFTLEEALERALQKDSRKMILTREKGLSHQDLYFAPLSSESFYASLRLADQMGIEEIVIVCDEEVQKNKGLLNRIEKSCGL